MRPLLARIVVGVVALTANLAPLAAQAPAPAAKPEDVSSVDAVVGALYHVISGPAGQKRDWDRFRSSSSLTMAPAGGSPRCFGNKSRRPIRFPRST